MDCNNYLCQTIKRVIFNIFIKVRKSFLNGVVDIIDNPGMYMVLPEKFQTHIEKAWKLNYNEIIATEINMINALK